jgi:hypothetical protein
MTRIAKVKTLAQVTAMTAALTAVGWTGSAVAQAAPHFHPHPVVPPAAGDAATDAAPTAPAEQNPIHHEFHHEFKGIIYFRNGVPIGALLPGQENASHIIDILVKCRPHAGNSHVNHDGFVFVHCS